MTQQRPNNLVYLNRDRGYRFAERDEAMIELCNLITKSNLSIGDIIDRVLDLSDNRVNIRYKTIANWLNGTTKRPQNCTMTWVGLALGYKRSWEPF